MRTATPEQGGWFRGGRSDRFAARPGGFGASGRPIGEEFRSRKLRMCARGHSRNAAGEATIRNRPQSPVDGVSLSSAENLRQRAAGPTVRRAARHCPRTPSSQPLTDVPWCGGGQRHAGGSGGKPAAGARRRWRPLADVAVKGP
ncbi:hypothetical protein GCM10018793_58810 [Streptomyces sulfonofaciens]|uniref:Uncharacterized protein n=1 Tax=Streptomyces sulfonofaciens TaxID=68272 RepID=A0A919GLM1_9ACTN|nr:hypothetical protein GCM10018793_58810 [Streptomyces sulfonofaciens]